MAAIFTHQITAATIEPDLLQTRELRRDSRSIVLPLQGSAQSLIISRPPAMRSGTHVLFFMEQADATAALDVLAVPGTLQLVTTAPDPAAWSMDLAIVGDLQLTQEGAGLRRWIVSADWLEVSP